MLALLLTLDEGQQLHDLGHQLLIVAEDFTGLVESDAGAIQQRCASARQSMAAGEKSFRFSATTLMQRGRVGWPSASINGGTSCSTRLTPATKL